MALRYPEDTLTGPYIMNLREARSEDFKAPLFLICLWLLQRRWLKGILYIVLDRYSHYQKIPIFHSTLTRQTIPPM